MSLEFPADLRLAPMFYQRVYAVAYNQALVEGFADPDAAGRQAIERVDQRVKLKRPRLGAWAPRSAESVYSHITRLLLSVLRGAGDEDSSERKVQ